MNHNHIVQSHMNGREPLGLRGTGRAVDLWQIPQRTSLLLAKAKRIFFPTVKSGIPARQTARQLAVLQRRQQRPSHSTAEGRVETKAGDAAGDAARWAQMEDAGCSAAQLREPAARLPGTPSHGRRGQHRPRHHPRHGQHPPHRQPCCRCGGSVWGSAGGSAWATSPIRADVGSSL